MTKETFTYIHVWSGIPRYVGKAGCKRRTRRLSSRRGLYGEFIKAHKNEHVCMFITSVHGDDTAALLNEQGLISWLGLRQEGGLLMNTMVHGDGWKGGKRMTKEQRAHLSKINTGKKLTKEHKKAIGDGGRGKKRSDEAKERIRQAQFTQPKLTCPHCGMTSNKAPMTRHIRVCPKAPSAA